MSDQDQPKRPVILSGMKPTSELTLGNYIGALRNWVKLQETHDCLYTVVDLHAITIRMQPAELRKQSLDVAAQYIAFGVDVEKHTLFLQSHVPEHSQLAWALNCYTQMGECNRMTQFKEKSGKQLTNVNVGLFTYPILMAADILLYQADLVPVGDDQKQHLELTRNIAERFNNLYSPTFTLPEPYIPKVGARIMSLQDPLSKMSKSEDNPKATIFLSDGPDVIRNKIKRAVTDSGTEIRMGDDRPAISNLLTLYHIATGQDFPAIEAHFAGKGYADLKTELADALVAMLGPYQEKYRQIRSSKDYLAETLKIGAEKAHERARKTLRKVYKKVGFVEPAR